MSGVLKSIGKVFLSPISVVIGGKAGKIIRKVALGAIAVGAVALTGGAALGILPSLGTMVGGLGLSAGLTSALTGAISSGAVGAVGGLLTGGFKGMTKGLLMGAATGGIMGGLGVLGPDGLIGGGKAVAGGIAPSAAPSFATAVAPGLPTTITPLTQAAGAAASGGAAAGLSSLGPSFAGAAAPSITSTIAPLASALPNVAAPVAAGGAAGGIGGLFGSNPLLASQLLTGISQAFTPSEASEAAKARTKAEQEQSYFAYGGGDTNGKKKGGIMPGVYSGQADPFGLKSYGAPPPISPESYYKPSSIRYAYNPTTSTIEEIRA